MLKSYRDPANPKKPVTIKRPHVDDALYTKVVRSFPIPTVDVVFTVPGKKVLYLATRNVYPTPGPWYIGGRIYFNDDTLEEAMVRTMERETGMHVDATRFALVLVAYYSWFKIKQGGVGKNISFSFRLEVSPEELNQIGTGLAPSEYDVGSGLKAYDRKRLVREKCHPVLIDLYDAIYPR